MKYDNQIIHVLHLLEHLKVGGAERLVFDLVHTFDSSRFKTTVCLYRDLGIFADRLKDAGYQVVFLRKDILTRFFPDVPRIVLAPLLLLESFVFIVRFASLMRNLKVQILHSHMFSANLWGRLSSLLVGRLVVITTEHNVNGRFRSLKHSLINRLLLPLSNKVVAVSGAVAETVVNLQRPPAKKLVVIRNGIRMEDIEKYRKSDINPQYSHMPGEKPIIVSIGRLVPQKRHDLLLEALRVCADNKIKFSCWIIGGGPEKSNLENKVKQLNLSDIVFFLGERSDARELLHYVDMVVNTSDKEGLPISLLEAMAARLPVVAADVGGNREIIQNGETGVLVEPGNIKAIADGILKLLQNPELAKNISQIGYEKVKNNYSIEVVAKNWENLYEELQGENKKIN
jgi:glycosyltransferase involved in cell wall biosynthesis